MKAHNKERLATLTTMILIFIATFFLYGSVYTAYHYSSGILVTAIP